MACFWLWICSSIALYLLLPCTVAQEQQCYVPTYRVITVPIPGFVDVVTNYTGTYYSGFIIDVVSALARVADFRYTITVTGNAQFGRSTGTAGSTPCFNGAIGALQAQDFDILAGALDNVLEVTKAVDFTTPVFRSKVQIIYNANTGLANSNYAVIANTPFRDLLANLPDPRLQAIWQSILKNAPSSLPNTLEEATQLVKQGGWALVGRTPALDQIVCESNGLIVKDPQILKTIYGAFAVQKDSNLLRKLNLAILKLHEDHTISNLMAKWFPCTDEIAFAF